MPKSNPLTNDAGMRERAERNLGALVIAIEFTLISVMVGVILFPLMDFATPILHELKFEYMLYIVSGLVLIMAIWSEVISHSLSFIGWPMDMFHNLLYILLAMVLAIQMHFLQDPLAWFAMTVLTATTAAAITLYDRHLIQERLATAHGTAAELFGAALHRQQFLVRVAPFTILNAIVQVALVYFLPGWFLGARLHLVLVLVQISAFTYLTYRTITAFQAARALILQKAMEELERE